MPRLSGDISDEYGGDDDIPHTPRVVDGADKQVTNELKDDLKKDEHQPEEKDEHQPEEKDEHQPEEKDEKAATQETEEDEGDEEEDEADEDDEDAKGPVDEEGMEYVVEAIRGHEYQKVKGSKNYELRYLVKWKGWREEDNTWEPEEHLAPASSQLVIDYHTSIGGRPEPPANIQLIKKRKSTASMRQDNIPEKRSKRSGTNITPGGWVPADKHWDSYIESIDTIEQEPITKQLSVLIRFKNGKMSKVTRDTAYDRCPRSMLHFYERHLTFK